MTTPAEREIAALMAEVREAEAAARLDGFETCEGLVAEMLEAMAEAEAGKAGLSSTTSERLGNVHGARAACLREAALAVRLGQARRGPKA